ncbi:MAG TPA: hypothetical protein VHC90_04365 [Bryobacteraceae bacterium]|nr:hypothetical protein [Bryobacteraceae bacterium]
MNRHHFWILLILLFVSAVSLGVVLKPGVSSGIVPWIQPRIISFYATPESVKRGDTATLTWETTGAASVLMHVHTVLGRNEETRSGLPPKGTVKVQPREDTVYVLECEGGIGGHSVSQSVSVRVKDILITSE